MYTLTWITPARRLETLSSPRRAAMMEAYTRFRRDGVAARLWFNGATPVM